MVARTPPPDRVHGATAVASSASVRTAMRRTTRRGMKVRSILAGPRSRTGALREKGARDSGFSYLQPDGLSKLRHLSGPFRPVPFLGGRREGAVAPGALAGEPPRSRVFPPMGLRTGAALQGPSRRRVL